MVDKTQNLRYNATSNLNDGVQELEKEKEMKIASIESLEQAEAAVNEIIMETIGFPPNTTIHDYTTVCKRLVKVVWRDEKSRPDLERRTLIAQVQSIDWHWCIGCALMCNISLDVSEETMGVPHRLFYNIDDGSWGWYNSASLRTGKRLTATVKLVA